MGLFRRSSSVQLALVSGFCVLALAALIPIPERLTASLVVQRCFDALHLPLFALAAGAALWFVLARGSGAADESRRGAGRRNVRLVALSVALAFVGIAALVEGIQPLTGRSASLLDFLYGAAGSGLGAWWVWRCKSWAAGERAGFWLLALVSVIAVGWPIMVAGQHGRQLAKAFPQLLVGDAQVDGAFWKGEGGAEIEFRQSAETNAGTFHLHAVTRPNEWSGVHFRPSTAAGDWSGRQHLVLQMSTNADTPFTLGLKIEDFDSSDHSTRFNHSISLNPGRREVRIALTEIAPELVDLRRVKRLALFVSADQAARSFVIEQAFLE